MVAAVDGLDVFGDALVVAKVNCVEDFAGDVHSACWGVGLAAFGLAEDDELCAGEACVDVESADEVCSAVAFVGVGD